MITYRGPETDASQCSQVDFTVHMYVFRKGQVRVVSVLSREFQVPAEAKSLKGPSNEVSSGRCSAFENDAHSAQS